MSPNSASEEAGVQAQSDQHAIQDDLPKHSPDEPHVADSSPQHTDQDVIAADSGVAESETSPAPDIPATEISEAVSKNNL